MCRSMAAGHAPVVFLVISTLFLSVALADDEPAKGLTSPFFVLGNGVQGEKFPTPEDQARVLAELGYDGIGPSGVNGIPEMLKALDAHGLKMHALYVGANLDPDKPDYAPELPNVIKQLNGRDTFVWLTVRSSKYKPSSSDGDADAVRIIRQLADAAEKSGLRVALYPHSGFYVQRVEDAVRVAEKVDRKNVGVTFNLCHWLKLDEPESMQRLVKLALPHLFLVTINGADHDGDSWDRLIQPLDRGSFDVQSLLETLHDGGFSGPIGLQCYAVPGDKYENLKRSMQAWQGFSRKMTLERRPAFSK